MRRIRGSVLIHVLVTGVIVSIITAGVLRMTLMNYIATARATSGASKRKESEALLSRAITYWNQANAVCANIPGGYSCTGTPGTCACDCPAVSATAPYIHAYMSGGVCKVNLVSSDPP